MKPSIQGPLDELSRRCAALEAQVRSLTAALPLQVASLSGTLNSGIAAASASLVHGRLLNVQVISAVQDYVPTSGTVTVLVEMVGAGGGGGGVSCGASQAAAGAGGGSGVYWRRFFSSVTSATGSCNPGAFGTGGGNSPTDGGAGGDTSFSLNGTTYVAKGGSGGPKGVATGGDQLILPVAPAAGTSTDSSTTTSYWLGGIGEVSDGPLNAWASGHGGSSPFGGGGVPVNGNAIGKAGSGFGAGGSGGAAGATQFAGGGNGSAGVIVIHEFS